MYFMPNIYHIVQLCPPPNIVAFFETPYDFTNTATTEIPCYF